MSVGFNLKMFDNEQKRSLAAAKIQQLPIE
jgi:hypothetical protein